MADSTGINRETGRPLTDFDHVVQSLGVIFTTQLGERVMRRHFGCAAPILLGRAMTPDNVVRFFSLIALAVEMWEPRFKIGKVTPRGSAEEVRLGHLRLNIEGIYMPRALQGDFTPDGGKRQVGLESDGLLIAVSA